MKRPEPIPRIFPVGALVIWPRPSDPIRDYLDVELVIRCRCGRSMQARVSELAEQHRIGPGAQIVALVSRLRCTGCRRGFPPPLGYEPPGPQPPPQAVFEFSELRVNPFPQPRDPPRSPQRKP
jgi:hypothetical protein